MMALLNGRADTGPRPLRRSGCLFVRATFRRPLHPASVAFERDRSRVTQWRLLYVVGRVSVPRAGQRSEFAPDARNRAANDGAHSRLQIARLSGERLARGQRDHERQVNAIIDGFLEANPDIDSRLTSYAHSASCGCVL